MSLRSSGAWRSKILRRDRGRRARWPRLMRATSRSRAGPRCGDRRGSCLAVGDLGVERAPARAVLGRFGNEDDRRRVLDVAVHRALRRVIEEGRHLVELALRERVELVVVAHRAAGRQAEPDLRGGLGAIARVQDQVLLGDHPPFAGGDVAAVEAGADQLIERAIGQQVAGELLDRELIERHVPVESIDHPIAIRPVLAIVVEVDAVGVGVSSVIQPVAAAMLSPLPATKQLGSTSRS